MFPFISFISVYLVCALFPFLLTGVVLPFIFTGVACCPVFLYRLVVWGGGYAGSVGSSLEGMSGRLFRRALEALEVPLQKRQQKLKDTSSGSASHSPGEQKPLVKLFGSE